MKTYKYKKSWLFVALAAVAVIGGLLTFGMRALAAAPTVTVGSDFKFLDAYHIQGTIDGQSIDFFDKNPKDSNHNFSPDDSTALKTLGLCQGNINNWGVNLKSSPNLSATSVSGTLVFGFFGQGNNSTVCTATVPAGNYSPSNKVSVSNPGSAAKSYYRWDGSGNIIKADNSQTFQSTNVSNVFINQANSGTCEASGIMVVGASGNTGALYSLAGVDGAGSTQNAVPNSISKYLQNPDKCSLAADPSTADIAGTPPAAVTGGNITCDPSTDSNCHCDQVGGQKFCSSNNPQNSGSPATTGSDSCVNSSGGFSLSWLLCPTLLAADAFATTTINLFENQLSFRVDDLNRNDGVNKVKTSWSLFRDIASALLVIVMLVMVISQAMGGGPFEAYTVRKLLPKLVVAVILMQISWSLMGYIVNLVDDVGHGLRDILYLPFRPGNLDDFGLLLHNAGVGNFGASTFSFVGLLAVGIGVAIALPTILMFAFIAILADVTGLAVLVFRKILILMALILAPLALLAWILPGTQSYFKLWYSNFLKALMMFPLVVAIIAAGRIFAYVAGTTGNGTFLNFFLVMVGFFGPLFILPKTFKWGGQAMQAVGNQAFKATSKLEERPKKYFQARQEDWSAARKAESQRRYGLQTPFNPMRFWQYPLDRFRSGQLDPLLGKAAWMPGVDSNARMRRRKMTGYKEQGIKTEEEDQAAADREAILDEKRLNELDYNHDFFWHDKLGGGPERYNNLVHPSLRDKDNPNGRTYRQRDEDAYRAGHDGSLEGFEPGYHDYTGRVIPIRPPEDQFAKNAILTRMSELGADTNHLEILRYAQQELASGDGERIASIQKYMQDHKDHFLKNYPHLLKGRGSTLDSNEIYGIHGAGMGDLVARTTWAINNPRQPEDQKAEQARLRKFVKTSLENMKSTRGDSIEQGARRVLKALGTRDESAREAVLVRNPDTGDPGVNTNRRQRIYKGTRPDGEPIMDSQTKVQNHLPEIEITPAVLAALEPGVLGPEDLRAELDKTLDASGAYLRGRAAAPPATTPRRDPHADRDFSDSRPPDEPGHASFSYAPNQETVIARAVSGPAPPSQTYVQQTNETNVQQTVVQPGGPASTSRAPAPVASASTYDSQSGSYEPTVQQPASRVIERVTNNVVSPSSVPQSVVAPTQAVSSASEPQTVYTRQAGTIVAPSSNAMDQRTAEELDWQLRNVYKELRKLGTRNEQQQQQFEQLRSQHPGWDNDDNV